MKRNSNLSAFVCTALALAGCTSKTVGGGETDTSGSSDSTGGGESDTTDDDDGDSEGTTGGTTDSGSEGASDDGTTVPGCTEPGELVWSWEEPAFAHAIMSPVAGGKLSVIAGNGGEEAHLLVLDAGNGSVVEDFELAGDDAPVSPLLTDDTTVYLQRDDEGRTYILHAESAGGDFKNAMVYRYAADGTGDFGVPLNPTTGSGPEIYLDGSGGVVVQLEDLSFWTDVLYRVASDGTAPWSHHSGSGNNGSNPHFEGSFVQGNVVWLTGWGDGPDDASSPYPWIGQIDLETGEPTGVEIDVAGADDALLLRIAPREGGGFFVSGFLDPETQPVAFLGGVDEAGSMLWTMETGPQLDELDTEWSARLRALPDGSGACASSLNYEYVQAVHFIGCADADGNPVLELESYQVEHDRAELQLDAAGNLYVARKMSGKARVDKHCSPF